MVNKFTTFIEKLPNGLHNANLVNLVNFSKKFTPFCPPMDSAEPAIAIYESFSVAGEREYTAHGRWVMAELAAKAAASLIADSNETYHSKEGVELLPV